jgi:dTDP-4-dehydrorhamnose reductase
MVTKQNILITGSNGQLGSEIRDIASRYSNFEFYFLTRNDFSLNEPGNIEGLISKYQPQYLINCAAYTAVDKAESEKEEAFQINAAAVGIIASACAKHEVKFIHISTDYVFDGNTKTPLSENHRVSPMNVYGESKLAGEQTAIDNNPDAIIIRTSWVYSFYGNNFVKTMIRLMAEKESINVVGDQFGSPTYAADLAKAIIHIIESEKWLPGIYHFSNDGTITWADFAKEIATQINSGCFVNPIPTSSYPTPARRPLFSVMDKSKIQTHYGIQLRGWKESLRECIQKLKSH